MPEPPQEHGNRDVAVSFVAAVPVAPQGDVEIIFQPAGEADMPSLPELPGVGGKIWKIEVDHNIESHAASQSPGNI